MALEQITKKLSAVSASDKVAIKPCLKCGRKGERNAIEILPDNGVLWMVVHDDGQVCRWPSYNNIEDLADKGRKHKQNPTKILCPKCNQMGRVNHYHKRKGPIEETSMNVEYYISHEPIQGTWGKKEKTTKFRRCQNFTQAQRDEILKQLNRYISTPKIPKSKLKAKVKKSKIIVPKRKDDAELLALFERLRGDMAQLKKLES